MTGELLRGIGKRWLAPRACDAGGLTNSGTSLLGVPFHWHGHQSAHLHRLGSMLIIGELGLLAFWFVVVRPSWVEATAWEYARASYETVHLPDAVS